MMIELVKPFLVKEFYKEKTQCKLFPHSNLCFTLKEGSEIKGICLIGNTTITSLNDNLLYKKIDNSISELNGLWVAEDNQIDVNVGFIKHCISQAKTDCLVAHLDYNSQYVDLYNKAGFDYLGQTFGSNSNNSDRKESTKHRYIHFLNENNKKYLRFPVISQPDFSLFLIYGLYNPEELGGELKYIGQSSTGLKRPNEHSIRLNTQPASYKTNWIKGLDERGFKPVIKILDCVAEGNLSIHNINDRLNNLETFYIEKFKKEGINLSNLTGGGEGTLGKQHSEETKEKLRQLALGRKKGPSPTRRHHVIIDGVEMKFCSGCNENKTLDNYSNNNANWDKLARWCRICTAATLPKYKNVPDEVKKQNIANGLEKRAQLVKEYFQNNPEAKLRVSEKTSKPVKLINIITNEEKIYKSLRELTDELGFNYQGVYAAMKGNRPYNGFKINQLTK